MLVGEVAMMVQFTSRDDCGREEIFAQVTPINGELNTLEVRT